MPRWIIFAVAAWACGGGVAAAASPPLAPEPVTRIIHALKAKILANPDDFIAYNKLAGYYLQRQRETSDDGALVLAERAARASLAILPAAHNYGGLAALGQVALSRHQFATARTHANQLITLAPTKSLGFQILYDALTELGEYAAAEQALARLTQLADGSVAAESRLGQHARLQGRMAEAKQHLTAALHAALAQPQPLQETVAWCHWQLGELAYAVGDYTRAEPHYAAALTAFPEDRRALAGLGRVRYAQCDLPGAIAAYTRLTAQTPQIPELATLGDLYYLAGRIQDAAAQYAALERLPTQQARLHPDHTHHVRQLALFYADHGIQTDTAYALAAQDYALRPSVAAADALAWTAFKAGKLQEAQAQIQAALRLGTQEAQVYYHAGMIAQAAGAPDQARAWLERALTLNPRFAPWQAEQAQHALATLDATAPEAAKAAP